MHSPDRLGASYYTSADGASFYLRCLYALLASMYAALDHIKAVVAAGGPTARPFDAIKRLDYQTVACESWCVAYAEQARADWICGEAPYEVSIRADRDVEEAHRTRAECHQVYVEAAGIESAAHMAAVRREAERIAGGPGPEAEAIADAHGVEPRGAPETQPPAPEKKRRHRRTKAEMQAARAAATGVTISTLGDPCACGHQQSAHEPTDPHACIECPCEEFRTPAEAAAAPDAVAQQDEDRPAVAEEQPAPGAVSPTAPPDAAIDLAAIPAPVVPVVVEYPEKSTDWVWLDGEFVPWRPCTHAATCPSAVYEDCGFCVYYRPAPPVKENSNGSL